ncbi:MAG: hypothetical protein JWM34_3417 [Ilumatobacteraceae bacterium]|nr:hypothetical protein [Ilumatobacteraceae bacterium]
MDRATDPPPAQVWTVRRTSPVRADADALFIAATEMAEASIGDRVTFTSDDAGPPRAGTVAETTHRGRERYFRVTLDP